MIIFKRVPISLKRAFAWGPKVPPVSTATEQRCGYSSVVDSGESFGKSQARGFPDFHGTIEIPSGWSSTPGQVPSGSKRDGIPAALRD